MCTGSSVLTDYGLCVTEVEEGMQEKDKNKGKGDEEPFLS